MDLRGVGVCLFLNRIKPFHCLESSTFFKAAEHRARLQFAFPRSPAFRAPKNNEPPPAPPLQRAEGRRKASSRLPPNHLTCLDAFSSPLEGTGNFFSSSFCERCLQRVDQTPLFPVSCRLLCSGTSRRHSGEGKAVSTENKMKHWLADGGASFIHSFTQ